MVAVDIMGPFPKNQNGNCYILVAEDCFTKWLETWAIPVGSQDSCTKVVGRNVSPLFSTR